MTGRLFDFFDFFDFFDLFDFFDFFDLFFSTFRVLPVEPPDTEEMFLADSADGAKGFAEGYLLTNPLDLHNLPLSSAMQQIGIRRIGDVFGRCEGVHVPN
jgi:hypothetical protein